VSTVIRNNLNAKLVGSQSRPHEQQRGEPGNSGSPALLTRRDFAKASLAFGALVHLPWPAIGAATRAEQTFEAAIIGHTGQGNYGHDQDLIFNGHSNIQLVAVADPDPAGCAAAAARSGALRKYADYREMLEKEKPNLVCIAPRWTGEHHAMGLAALQAGAHLYLEKPITQTLAQADELLAVASQRGLRIVVAHQMRLAPNILVLKQSIDEGLIGELLEVRSHGKQDHRAGGEDLVVLGVHLFDLMRFFAGDPLWCAARVLQNGREIAAADAHLATENIGPVVGDEILAEFAFPEGVQGTFTSRGRNRETAGPWGMELVGTKGSIKIQMEMIPKIYQLDSGPWAVQGQKTEWRVWDEDPTLQLSAPERTIASANQRVMADWLAAIAAKREPVCSGYSGMKALEMAMAVFAGGLTRGRVQFPLKQRDHPLRT
jgi:predicted dehydrogenase